MTRAKSSISLLLFCLSFLLLPTETIGQANFRYLNKKDGLSQVSVFAIAQDSLGFIWFGTRDGLNKYDGNRFWVYRSGQDEEGIAGNDIRTLYTDPRTQDLWVGTQSGLSRYNAASDNFMSYESDGSENSLWGNAVRCIHRDGGGDLWVGTAAGLNLYDPVLDRFRRIKLVEGTGGEVEIDVTFLAENQAGDVFAGTNNGLFLLKTGEEASTSWQVVAGWEEEYLTCGQFDGQGNLWLGTFKNGLIRWKVGTSERERLRNDPAEPGSLSNNQIRTLAFTPKGDLWAGTFNGLNLLPVGQRQFIHYSDSSRGNGPLLHNSIHSLLVDRSDKLWVGTYYGGIHHFDERYNYFVNYQSDPYQNSLNANVVSSFAQDEDGDLWVGTEGGGLNYFQREGEVFSSYQWQVGQSYPLQANNVKTLLLDDEDLWVGTYGAGLTRFHTVTKQKKHFGQDSKDGPVLSSDNVYGLLRDGERLWVLTYGGGLNLIDLMTNTVDYFRYDLKDSTSISSDRVRTILKTEDGNFWIGTERGLNLVEVDDQGLPVSFASSLHGERIYALAPAEQGLWVGTFSGGLIRCDEQGAVVRRYTTEDGLPDNSIFGILETEEGILWLSTGNGLSRFDPAGAVFNNFNEANGLENLEFNFNAAFRTKEGDFLFGGINGFTRFDPAAFSPNLTIPPVVFTRLLRNNQEVAIGGPAGLLTKSINATTELIFSYDEADFTIEFAALDYFSPQNNHYAYILEGLDRDWNYGSGKTQASYTIQREGNYTFRLRGGNSDGVWNPQQRVINIKVLPPPWRSWWAYLLYFFLAGLTVFALVRILRLRHQVQLQEVAKRQQDELMEMKLRFFTNITHEFRTPLTLILGPLEQLISKIDPQEETGKQLGLINRNAQRLLNLVNQVLTFRRLATDHEPMRISKSSLQAFIADIYMSFEGVAELRNIDYQLTDEAGPLEVWCDQGKLEKVFFNLLSNAFKFTPDHGKIEVSITRGLGETVRVCVKDNGKGIPPELHQEVFKRFYEKSSGEQSHIKSSGIGLAVSRKMVELHGGNIFIEDNKEPGAAFVVVLQLGRDHFSEVVTEIAPPPAVLVATPVAAEDAPVTSIATEQTPQTLLVVDDNEEIRTYVATIFAKEYKVITAKTGKEGLSMARQQLPAMVISDVMMPEMDGMAFCQALKEDIEISHIPVILLTARSGQLFRIKGLRTGADDYVTKPFNPEELRLRVANILKNRRRFKDTFRETLSVEPSRVEVTSIDEQLLRQIVMIAEQNVHDPHYKVEAFARDLAVSRTLLFNKLKALTGQTPSKFLKTFRMKRAAQLLEDSDYRIGKIASMVGFRDDRYFRECFKKEFGVAPDKYRKSEQRPS